MSLTTAKKKSRFKLRTILLAVSLAVLVIPLGGIFFFRIYEGELVKQTEMELIAQAALIAAIYRREVESLTKVEGGADAYGIKVASPPLRDEHYRPVKPQLNLSASQIKERPPAAVVPATTPDKIALQVGARLMPTLLDAQRTTLAGIRLLDYHGIVIGGREDLGKSLAHLVEVQEARAGRYSSTIRERTIRRPTPPLTSISRGTGVRVFIAFPITTGDRLYGIVFLSRTPASILEHLYSQIENVVLTGAIILLLIVSLAVFTSYSIARPLHALIQQTKQFAVGDKKAMEPLAAPVTEEVAQLSESFSEMARKLEQRAEYIRDFATHVSHEFKTPLSAIQGAIELLEDHANDMRAEKRAHFLRNIGQDTDRLRKLVDRLLEMARADALAPAVGTCEIAPLVERLRVRYQSRGLSVSWLGSSGVKVKAPPEILETVFSNIFDNSQQNGADRIDVTCEQEAGDLMIDAADNGRGVSPANVEKIFMPFFTTHREEGGTGLGLRIVRSLMRAYGGDIDLVPTERGATFRVTMPASSG